MKVANWNLYEAVSNNSHNSTVNNIGPKIVAIDMKNFLTLINLNVWKPDISRNKRNRGVNNTKVYFDNKAIKDANIKTLKLIIVFFLR